VSLEVLAGTIECVKTSLLKCDVYALGNFYEDFIFKAKSFKIKNKDISAISFFGGNSKWVDQVDLNKKIDLIYSIEKSYFRGRPEVRLRIIDLKLIYFTIQIPINKK
jgi:hypothetical protein